MATFINLPVTVPDKSALVFTGNQEEILEPQVSVLWLHNLEEKILRFISLCSTEIDNFISNFIHFMSLLSVLLPSLFLPLTPSSSLLLPYLSLVFLLGCVSGRLFAWPGSQCEPCRACAGVFLGHTSTTVCLLRKGHFSHPETGNSCASFSLSNFLILCSRAESHHRGRADFLFSLRLQVRDWDRGRKTTTEEAAGRKAFQTRPAASVCLP